MILSDRTLYEIGPELLSPFLEQYVQPASYDLRVQLAEPLILRPFEFHLLSTVEVVYLPANVQGQVHGRSSLGRKGVLIHFTAGFIDPGFRGQITLEVMNLDKHEPPVRLEPFDRIAQIAFYWLDRPAQRPYNGRYQHQYGATPSRFEHGDA